MILNVKTHLNLVEDVTQLVPTSAATFDISGPPLSIHDVELQYAEDEDVEPFYDL